MSRSTRNLILLGEDIKAKASKHERKKIYNFSKLPLNMNKSRGKESKHQTRKCIKKRKKKHKTITYK